ncbi:hypothetical protein GOODEAATRI_023996 [Goodea atripinnis]|uniref:Uncharacterized protein n=1 Tax=Goodea atripinnis TaxID=208336 RepID=A0ABV0P7C1_9TELE
MAWACFLTISEESSSSISFVPRTALLCHEGRREETKFLQTRFFSACFTELWAMWGTQTDALVTQAGQEIRGVDVSELQSTFEFMLLELNHLIRLWGVHLAGISPITHPERPHQTW